MESSKKSEGVSVAPRRMMDAPDDFTAKGIKEFLKRNGAAGIIEIGALSIILGTCDTRTIREHIRAKKLKPLNQPVGRESYIFDLDEVVKWLVSEPKYVAQRQTCWEVTEETTDMIRAILHKSWPTLLRFLEEEDIVAEVQCRMLTMPKTCTAEGLVITRTLAKIYRDLQRRPRKAVYDDGRRVGTRA